MPRLIAAVLAAMLPFAAWCAPRAALVMDARTGQVYAAEDADRPLHPASLTKMMTLYVAFAAAEAGRLDWDDVVAVSGNAAAEGGSSLGLRAGQRIALRGLVRAVAVKSANDAATALAEAVAGSEAAFVARMNDTARRLGMADTTFRNAHGLTADGHLSTARDMTVLGRRLWWDFPDYWHLYSRLQIDAGPRRVAHTNRRFLSSYPGADGIKTGYTRAAGYNLTASAVRGEVRLIATVFGADSSADRAARMARLMDAGFARAPAWARPVPPSGRAPDSPVAVASAPAAARGLLAPAAAPLWPKRQAGSAMRARGEDRARIGPGAVALGALSSATPRALGLAGPVPSR